MPTRGDSGYSLVELLVVVAIIGILSAIAIPQYAVYKRDGLDTGARSVLHNLATAMEGYFVATNSYAGATLVGLQGSYGYRPGDGVTAAIATADAAHYVLTAFASGGSGTFTFDSTNGAVTGP